jgi:glycogen operon protein
LSAAGRPYPLGATVVEGGINFAVFSRNATAVYLELFDHPDDRRPVRTLALDPLRNRTGDVWHAFVPGLCSGQLYGLRADGPYLPEGAGHRFNVNKLLADPYARALQGHFDLEQDAVYGYVRGSPDADLSFSRLDSAGCAAKCVALGPDGFDWQDDRPLRTPPHELVIYEVHVRGFSVHPSAGARHPGTFLGLVERIPHLLDLGVNAVELLPVHEFNEGEPVGFDPQTGLRLKNYWGYNTVGFFAPEDSYAAHRSGGTQVRDFKEMVRRLHAAGIEVILDVVFNHTGEGHELGPTFSFRGLDNAVYYMLDGGRRYRNYSGTGNTVNCNHPVLKQLILDCLRYWVVEMHVDGFRFDLATILGRGRGGQWIGDLSLLYDIGGDPVLRGCKLIAESWDADGMYKVGGFPRGWAEWNGRFRDDLRRFVRGDPGMVPWLARRLGGSLDLFGSKRSPARSINFVTCHDGFTLRDLVSYERKHNERNGEDNRDGADENFSSNWGVEGETGDPALRALRLRQGKNLLCMLLLARGTPMLLAGDELWRTKQGNNNTYCQDNDLEWFDWDLQPEGQQMLRFCRALVHLRRRHPALRRPLFVDPFARSQGQGADISWHGVTAGRPDWSLESRTLACQFHGPAPGVPVTEHDSDLYAAFSAWSEPLDFTLPPPGRPGERWHRLLDTALPSPDDITTEAQAPPVEGPAYRVQPRSVVLLVARRT